MGVEPDCLFIRAESITEPVAPVRKNRQRQSYSQVSEELIEF